MRIQCSCGAEYDFDVTPEMAATPVHFVCSTCGADNSTMLNEMVRHQLSGATPAPTTEYCLKHGLPTTQRCLVCQKPICPKCMEVFGYACSVVCTEAARKVGFQLPVYEGNLFVVRARARRKARLIGVSVAAAVAVVLFSWSWYQFVASQPRVSWSIKFPEAASEGDAKFLSAKDALLLRGGRLIRYDLAAKKEKWSVAVADKMRADDSGPPLHWHIQGNDIWVAVGDNVVRYDGQSGQVAQEIPVGGGIQHFVPGPSAIAIVARGGEGGQLSIRIDLATGEVKREEVALPSVAKAGKPPPSVRPPLPTADQLGSGPAPIRAARSLQLLANRPLPSEEDEPETRKDEPFDYSRSEIIAGGGGLVQLSVELVEKKIVTVQAMKDPPKKSALDGDVSAASTIAAVSDTLNEWQRERTGGVDQEDASRYRVRLKRLLEPGASEWIGEVVGPPDLFALPSVNVLTAGRNVLVFDKANRKAWECRLAYGVGSRLDRGQRSLFGEDAELTSPCVERDGTLFIVDQGMVTAFALTTGNVLWRLPGVGTSGLVFDDCGMVYLNTTDAAQERLKYSQQIDLESKTRPLILKVDPKSGKILWRTRNVGRLAKATGKFLYAVEWAAGDDGAPLHPKTMPAHLRIHRLDPDNGAVIWEYYQPREPLALDFERNTIQVLFKKEMQVIKFFSF